MRFPAKHCLTILLIAGSMALPVKAELNCRSAHLMAASELTAADAEAISSQRSALEAPENDQIGFNFRSIEESLSPAHLDQTYQKLVALANDRKSNIIFEAHNSIAEHLPMVNVAGDALRNLVVNQAKLALLAKIEALKNTKAVTMKKINEFQVHLSQKPQDIEAAAAPRGLGRLFSTEAGRLKKLTKEKERLEYEMQVRIDSLRSCATAFSKCALSLRDNLEEGKAFVQETSQVIGALQDQVDWLMALDKKILESPEIATERNRTLINDAILNLVEQDRALIQQYQGLNEIQARTLVIIETETRRDFIDAALFNLVSEGAPAKILEPLREDVSNKAEENLSIEQRETVQLIEQMKNLSNFSNAVANLPAEIQLTGERAARLLAAMPRNENLAWTNQKGPRDLQRLLAEKVSAHYTMEQIWVDEGTALSIVLRIPLSSMALDQANLVLKHWDKIVKNANSNRNDKFVEEYRTLRLKMIKERTIDRDRSRI